MKGFISTGEFSGEIHACEVVKLMDFPLYGVGGERLEKEGVRIIGRSKAVVGFRDVPGSLFYFVSLKKKIIDFLRKERPSFVLLVDFPGFNMEIGKGAGSMGIPVFYLLPPQIWAWGRWRGKRIKKWVRKVFVFFDFEKRIWEEEGVEVECTEFPWKEIERKEENVIGIFPGSRESEVKRNLPFMLEVAEKFKEKIKVVVCIPWEREREEKGIFYTSSKERVLSSAMVAISKPGTITLELALSGIPAVVTAHVPFIDKLAGRMLLKTRYLALPNILLGEEVFPEVFEKERVLEKLFEVMEKKEEIKEKLSSLKEVAGDGVYERVCSSILSFFNN